jgi:hypothetical protein
MRAHPRKKTYHPSPPAHMGATTIFIYVEQKEKVSRCKTHKSHGENDAHGKHFHTAGAYARQHSPPFGAFLDSAGLDAHAWLLGCERWRGECECSFRVGSHHHTHIYMACCSRLKAHMGENLGAMPVRCSCILVVGANKRPYTC